MSSTIQQALIFIIQFVFGLYAFLLALRVWLRAMHADYHHPFVGGVAKVTAPLIKRLKCIPDIKNIELASIVLLFVVTLVKLILVSVIVGHIPNLFGLIMWTLGTMLEVGLDVVFYVMIFMALLSWMPQVQPMLFGLLSQLTQPLLQPVRKIIPLLGGMDISPIVVLLIAQLLDILIAHPLIRVGLNAALH